MHVFSTINSIRNLPNIFKLLFTHQTKLTFIIAFTTIYNVKLVRVAFHKKVQMSPFNNKVDIS